MVNVANPSSTPGYYLLYVCPRCDGQAHMIEVQKLSTPVPSPKSDSPYRLFAICPTSQQPIMFREFTAEELQERGPDLAR